MTSVPTIAILVAISLLASVGCWITYFLLSVSDEPRKAAPWERRTTIVSCIAMTLVVAFFVAAYRESP